MKTNKQNKNKKNRTNNRSSIVRRAPVSKSTTRTSVPPSISSVRDSVVVSHTELLSTVSSTTSFSLTKIPLDPCGTGFLWLQRIASNFQTYEWLRLKFEYRSITTTSKVGSYVMVLDSNVTSRTPSSRAELVQFKNAVISNYWQNSSIELDPRDYQKGKRFVSATGDTSTDTRLSAVGSLYVATDQSDSAASVGELYVSYTIRLTTARLASLAFAGGGGRTVGTTVNIGAGTKAPVKAFQNLVNASSQFLKGSTDLLNGRLVPLATEFTEVVNGKLVTDTYYGFQFTGAETYQILFSGMVAKTSKNTAYQIMGPFLVDTVHSSFSLGLGNQYYIDAPMYGSNAGWINSRTVLLLTVLPGDKLYLYCYNNDTPGDWNYTSYGEGAFIHLSTVDWFSDVNKTNPSLNKKRRDEDRFPMLIPINEYEQRMLRDSTTLK